VSSVDWTIKIGINNEELSIYFGRKGFATRCTWTGRTYFRWRPASTRHYVAV